MRKTLLSALAVALMLAGAGRLPAAAPNEEAKPAAVVLLPSYNAPLAHVSLPASWPTCRNLRRCLDASVTGATQGKGLAGLDKTKPLGVAIYLDDGMSRAPRNGWRSPGPPI